MCIIILNAFFSGHLFIKGGYAMPGTIPSLGTTGSLDNTPIFDETGRKPSDADVQKSLFHKGELSFGVVLGFCTGYLIKKVGKLFALAVGAGFIFLQVKKKTIFLYRNVIFVTFLLLLLLFFI